MKQVCTASAAFSGKWSVDILDGGPPYNRIRPHITQIWGNKNEMLGAVNLAPFGKTPVPFWYIYANRQSDRIAKLMLQVRSLSCSAN